MENRALFDNCYLAELEKNRGLKLAELVETPDHSSYTHNNELIYKQMYKGRKYEEELLTNSNHKHSQDSVDTNPFEEVD